jgi:hypothetical protein
MSPSVQGLDRHHKGSRNPTGAVRSKHGEPNPSVFPRTEYFGPRWPNIQVWLLEIAFSAIFLINHSLAKTEQKNSEIVKELNVASEARKVDKATFEEATRRLESRVSSLEAELERSRESYVV